MDFEWKFGDSSFKTLILLHYRTNEQRSTACNVNAVFWPNSLKATGH